MPSGDRFDPNKLSGFTGAIVNAVAVPVKGVTGTPLTNVSGRYKSTVLAADGKKQTEYTVPDSDNDTIGDGYLTWTVTVGTTAADGGFTATPTGELPKAIANKRQAGNPTDYYGTVIYGAFGTAP